MLAQRLIVFGIHLDSPEAIAISERVTAEHGDESVDDETDDQQHFAERCPELSLAVPT